MSLGLNDVKKNTRAPKVAKPTDSDGGAGATSENWALSKKIARPWATTGLEKGPKGRQRAPSEVLNASMSAEWVDDHTATIHVFEMEAQSPATQLRELKIELTAQAIELERKIKRAAKSPLQILRSVLQLVRS